MKGESRILPVVRKMHEAVLDCGVKRMVTTVKIDERRDKASSISSKVESVKERLSR